MRLPNFDINSLPTPYIAVDGLHLRENLKKLRFVAESAGCKILLAQKAFSMFSLYPLMRGYLDGTTASGLFEAKLGREEFGGETHIFSPSYQKSEFGEITELCDHIIFNSLTQWDAFSADAKRSKKSLGLRVNPEFSTQDKAIYDPCAPGSRLGITADKLEKLPDGVSGLHFHTLCEQNADALAGTLNAVEQRFGRFFGGIEWLNFGGGHHITRPDYDTDLLIDLIQRVKSRYGLAVYLEPGEAAVLDTGFLVASVIDITQNGEVTNAILDTSATCHMPDVIEMPYRPEVIGAGKPGEKAHTYRLGGPTCLAGDIIGDYSFETPLKPGDRLIFTDMAHYTMVKSNMFNGTNLPSIAYADTSGELKLIKSFGYSDFKGRLS